MMKNRAILIIVILFQIFTIFVLGLSFFSSQRPAGIMVVLVILGIVMDLFIYNSFFVLKEINEKDEQIKETSSLQSEMSLYREKAEQNLITLEDFQKTYIHQLIEIKDHLDSNKDTLDHDITETSHLLRNVFSEVYTENTIINTILVLKKTVALQSDIQVNYSIDVPESIPITELDICTILCNMLDNAIEAASECPIASRFLKLQIKISNAYMFISTRNSIIDKPLPRDFSKTTKINPEEHGFGVELIRSITEKYNGHLLIKKEDADSIQVVAALHLSL